MGGASWADDGVTYLGARRNEGAGGRTPAALLLTGDLGAGHHIVTQVVADSFRSMGFRTEVLDCMSLLGPISSRIGNWVFRRLIGLPTLYDGIHFSHFRSGSWLARMVDRLATQKLVPALADHLDRRRFDVVVASFATGASALARLGRPDGGPVTVVLCTDVSPHSLWVRFGIDLFLVTSEAAAEAVRRYSPDAPVAVVPPPVRAAFYEAPDRAEARRQLGVEADAPCVLLMGGGWGIGPLGQTARLLAERDVEVLAVAGRNVRLARVLDRLAGRDRRVHAYGFTEEIPLLMAAADAVLTTPGATTCGEARLMGRPLVLLDVMPGHGRDNIQHELEMGRAAVCDPDPHRLAACVSAVLDRWPPATGGPGQDRFAFEFARVLTDVGAPAPATVRRGRPHRRAGQQPNPLREVDLR
jgi:processive 1,2-diacylglycerol beta-glucosyltransferase